MKTLKTIMILSLFSNFITSCTVDDITEDSDVDPIENVKATGDNKEDVDETEKG